MITQVAIAGYRSLRDVTLELGRLTIVTGANGSGKSSLYRSLRLMADVAQGRLIASLAMEGGLTSTLWAGPEKIGRAVRDGRHPVQGTVRSGPISLKLGFSSGDRGYAIDLGKPLPGEGFADDPEIKIEAMWSGGVLGRSNLYAERRGPAVRVRRAETGEWQAITTSLAAFDSMVTNCADPGDGLELLTMRERMRDWRFYDNLRTDRDAPARRPQILTYTPVLGGDGADLAAAIATILNVGDGDAFAEALDDAFPGSRIAVAMDGTIGMHQQGLLRPLGAAELSDGTLRYMLLVAALLSPRPPELMVLNEPEVSLHPSLLDALARLLRLAAGRSQIVVVSHSERLIAALDRDEDVRSVWLDKDFGETIVRGETGPGWKWPSR